MSVQDNPSNSQRFIIELEIVPEDDQDKDLFAMSEAKQSLIESLTNDGYSIQPKYTGKRSTFIFEVGVFLTATYHIAVEHKDVLIEIVKTASPIMKHLLAHGGIKVELGIGDKYVKIDAPDLETLEGTVKLLEKHPFLAAQVTPTSKITVRAGIPKRHSRRHG